MTDAIPPYFKRAQKNDRGVAGRRGEKGLANRIGGELRPGSGSLKGAKGDIRKEKWLIESKTTTNATMGLKQDWLRKIYQEALEVGLQPALALTFVNGSGGSDKRDRWVMIPEWLWAELMADD